MNHTNNIKDDLIAWENSDYKNNLLDVLQTETKSNLRSKILQFGKLEKNNNIAKYCSPITFINFKKAVQHALRKRAWYWPIIKYLSNILSWYLMTFRNKYIENDKYIGFTIKGNNIFKTKWWQEDFLVVTKPMTSFAKEHWKFLCGLIVPSLLTIIIIYIMYLQLKQPG